MGKLTKSYLKSIILGANTTHRIKFKKYFKKEIDQFIESTFTAYKASETIQANNKDRKMIVDGFIYNAIQDIVSAFNIFISGYIVAPGNLMRQYHESVAWAILCSTNHLSYYNKIKEIWDAAKEKQTEKFKRLNKSMKFSDGLKFVEDNLNKNFPEINESGWKKFVKIRNFYHNLSHSSLIAMSMNTAMDIEGEVILGAYFDTGKIKHYKQEITTMISAVDLLPNIINGINQQIKRENL